MAETEKPFADFRKLVDLVADASAWRPRAPQKSNFAGVYSCFDFQIKS
jgi:hypothetical protein